MADDLAPTVPDPSGELWSALTGVVGDGIILTDASRPPDGPRIVFVNDAVLATTGYSREQLIGASPRVFQGPRTLAAERRRLRAAIEAGEPVRAELVNYRKDGSEFLIELDITPVRDAAGTVTGFVGIQRDVTERRLTDRWFRSLVEHSAEMMTVNDPNGTVRYVSPSVEALLGWRPEELVGRPGSELVHPDDARRLVEGLAAKSRQPGTNPPVEFRFRAADGSWRWLEAVTTNLLDEPAVQAMVVNARDISARKQLEVERERAERMYAAIVDGAIDAIVTIDTNGVIRSANRAALELLGATERGLTGTFLVNHVDMTLEDAVGTVRDAIARRVDGSKFPAGLSVSEVRLPEGRCFTVILRDLTETHRLHAELHDRAIHDGLTGLPNRDEMRRRLVEHAAVAVDEHGWSLVSIDIDGISLLNETFGHEVGDLVLREVTRRLRAAVPSGSTLSRFGGDEFLVLVPLDVTSAGAFVEQVMAALRAPLRTPGRTITVTACAGLTAVVPGDAEASLRRADLALNRAKAGGRDRWQAFVLDLEVQANQRVELELDLRTAVEDGELRLHFQPSFDLATDRVSGMEALVRWCHPTRGLLLPGSFIGIAEASGQIVDVGRWVVREACAARARMRAVHGAAVDGVTVWVNASARELEQPWYADEVVRTVRRCGVLPGEFGIELTESTVMADPDLALRHLQALAAAGVKVAIDDFGTGHSSFAYLAHLPVDLVKFDASFTQGAATDATTAVVVRSVIRLAHELGASTCLEGIETPEQLASASALGADMVAGFLLARPVPEDCVVVSGAAA